MKAKTRSPRRSGPGAASIAAVVSAILQAASRDAAAARLPVPCIGGSCGNSASSFVTSGTASAVQSGNTLTVQQGSSKAVLNWSSFNISADGKVVFQQPSSSAIALNRIYDANPSAIFGSLTANGQVYLINANGFLFGAGSKVNVAGLIASSLNISDSTFSSGILGALQNNGGAALQPFQDATGNDITNTGTITVQSGAQITAADGGRLLLAAPQVQNSGSIAAPDGQIVLAAGQKVYLQASSDSSLRGLIVEVDGQGKAWNQLTGELSAPRGNISLVGLAVNQDGRISATTTVSANGSVRLEAAQGRNSVGVGTTLSATQGGTVELGANSQIDVLPELSDTTAAVDAQTQLPSRISITGEKVFMDGATITAPGGNLTVLALGNPSMGVQSGGDANARIRIDPNTTIDLAGSSAELPMSANLVTVQLRSNELADDPTQRNGALRGTTVTVDMRADGGKGTTIADVSSAIAAVGKTIAQRTETGGQATFQSEGDIVFAQGASIDVSGGATTYDGGVVQTTKLVGANGKLYDIATANPLTTYTGVVNPTFSQTYDRWGVKEVIATSGASHYESGYVQGASAGKIQFAARSMALGGSIKATVTNGEYQRAASTEASGGTLLIGLQNPLNPFLDGQPIHNDYLAPGVILTSSAPPVSIDDNTPLPPYTLYLPTSYLTSTGITNTQINSNSRVTLMAGTPLVLPPSASLQVEAPRIDIGSSITSIGGILSFQSIGTVDSQDPSLPRLGIGVDAGVKLDVSGQWTNDSLLAGGTGTGSILQDGGAIKLQLTAPNSELVLGDGVALKADGGAWESASGKLTGGAGGSISIDAGPAYAALGIGTNVDVEAFGVQTAVGGTLSLTAPRISVSQGNGSAWTVAQRVDDLTSPGSALDIYAPLFSNYGFSTVNLTATGAAASADKPDVLTVTSGTTIDARTRSWMLQPGYQTRSSGGGVQAYSQVTLLPDAMRPIENISLSVVRGFDQLPLGSAGMGTIDVQQGASILADPKATISLESEGSISIDGILRARGGTLTAEILSAGTYDTSDASQLDPGFQPDQGIVLGSQAVLDVSGTSIFVPNDKGLLLGNVLSGGSVNLLAQRGTVTTESGSLINIAGTSTPLDVADRMTVGGYTHEIVASAGGTLTVNSPESISLLGGLEAHAGDGNSGTAAAGSLEVDLTRSEVIAYGAGFPGSALTIDLVGSTAAVTAAGPYGNTAVLGVDQLAQSGIDSLTLKAGGSQAVGTISFNTSEPLSLARQIVLDAPVLAVAPGVNATLSAPYVQMGNSLWTPVGTATPPPSLFGTGRLSVSAQQINLLGNYVVLQGVGAAMLSSSGDVQLEGTTQGTADTGSFTTAGDLSISAARVYPDTNTSFTIASVGSDATVTIGQTGVSPGTPLSAGGAVNISAGNIVIAGTLMAPFGSISLNAVNSLTLANGSLVSVSGAGLEIPYGQTQADGAQWIYQIPGYIQNISSVPAKQVTLSAPNINMQSGATVDVKGGGDLYAYEWVPGTGGHTDALLAGQIPGLYAIVPAQRGLAAPFDPEESSTHTATVYLSGGAGIPAGFYALLPPRYALLPGAYLVQSETGFTSARGGQIGALADGTPVVAGYLSSGNTGLYTGTSEYQGFAIYPGSYSQQLAAYNISQASTYFTALAAATGAITPVPIPADAGTLTFDVTNSLNNSLQLQGRVLSTPATGGRGAQINISAPDLEINTTGAASSSGALTVAASVLQGWNAGAFTLGGISSSDDSSIAVGADTVSVDGGVQLSAGQIVLVAQQAIDVKGGASLLSTSGKTGTPLASLPVAESVTLTTLNGNSGTAPALLAVSDLALPVVQHPAGSASGGTVTLEAGATLSSRGALALDGIGGVSVAGTISGQGASWSLGSQSIAFVGSGAGTSSDTLQIGSALLSSMQQAGTLRLASGSTIDLMTPVSLGAASLGASPTLTSLTLVGAAINNNATGDSVLGGKTLTLQGLGAGTSIPTAAGSGTLALVADELDIGPGTMGVNGFGRTQAQVAGAVVGRGTGGLSVGGDLAINAVELTAVDSTNNAASATVVPDSNMTLAATGSIAIGAPTALAASASLPSSMGGQLTLTAASIDDAGVIAMPSGLVTMNATDNLHLASTAAINVAGTTVHAVDQSAASQGGTVKLNAVAFDNTGNVAGGNVVLDSGATINVAGAGDAPAGTLNIVAAGTANVSATLTGRVTGNTTAPGGSFSLDAGQLAGGFTALASELSTGGFTNQIGVRVRTGNLTLENGAGLSANSISLTADSGAIDVAGTLSAASGSQRGFIGLYGGTAVSLEATGQLHADGAGSSGRGGEIELSSTCSSCYVDLAAGSLITASGAAQMGELILRAPAVGTSDVAINPGTSGLGADVSQAGQVIISPVLTFNETAATVTRGLANDVNRAVAYLSTAQTAISSRLTSNASMPPSVHAGVEIQDSNPGETLTLPSLDLSGFSQQGQVVDLTVRAAGGLTIAGTISDGYVKNGTTGPVTLENTASGTLSFVAGADLGSANPLSTALGSTADLSLTQATTGSGRNRIVTPAIVRTGTGDLSLVAAGDVKFGSGTSAYTGGIAAVNPIAFSLSGAGTHDMNFAADGGNLLVSAGVDIVGSPITGSATNESVGRWQIHQGNSTYAAQYGVDFNNFNWNTGALGGGDVAISAGRDVLNLSAATSNSLAAASTANGAATIYGGGGGLAINAGRDIGSAQIYVADGQGKLTAGGGLTAIQSYLGADGQQHAVGSSVALGDAQVSIWARQGVQIDAVYNPTLLPFSGNSQLVGRYFTYGEDSGLSVESTDGTVAFEYDTGSVALLLGKAITSSAQTGVLGDLPANLSMQALQGDIDLKFSQSEVLYPSSTGQLTLYAGRDIVGTGGKLVMSDSDAAYVPTAANPGITLATSSQGVGGLYRFQGDIHSADGNPALITAGRDLVDVGVYVPKAGRVVAGRDIVDLFYDGQNSSSSAITLVSAGRDIVNPSGSGRIEVGGEGSVDVLAGRNIDLGASDGITTQGNLENPNLASATGANLTVMAGLGAQGASFSSFLQQIIAPSSSYQAQLISYVESQTQQSSLTFDQAEAEFNSLSTEQQRALVDSVFFNELLLSGREANSSGAGFSRGYAAIDALFPNSRTAATTGSDPYSGNLVMTFSQIYTLSGGNISILTPGGSINVGLANPPASLAASTKTAGQLGIVAQGAGNVSIYSKGDVNVNKSRIFTLGGGNVLIWSDEGSIDAGNGSKSSLSVPPPTVLVSADGTITEDFSGSLSGSGIRTVQTTPSTPAGNVDLIAPQGTVNAGDAGIGSAGNLNIAATHVIGLDNISFGGVATGVPAEVSSLGASLSGASSAASGATTSATSAVEGASTAAKEVAPLAQSALSWLDVFVTGLGEENCKAEDMACLQRQKQE